MKICSVKIQNWQWIKRITAGEVEFAAGSKESLTDPDWRLIKPFIFWESVV